MGQTYPVICLGQITSRSPDGDACGYHMVEAEGVQSPVPRAGLVAHPVCEVGHNSSWTRRSNGSSAGRAV